MGMSFGESLKMGFDLFWTFVTAEPKLTMFLLLMIIFHGIYAVIINTIKQSRLRKSGILEIDKMNGKTFEDYLHALLKTRGYQIKLTPASGDYGADLVLNNKVKKIVVQAKRYKKNVGVKAVQEIVSAKTYYRADECWVITNSYFTVNAKKLAASNQVRLVDRPELMSWMLKENKTA
ncbi:restriction endonuclease [Sediminibacillus halophilus]|uniref:Restriction system protein n=1 Tax=Sediminibacillus halophilus TaxID=482461 RepID=A0A1G9NHF3_9BACI|nr:restriction endonuclease [Sediminibacillus halophilus]SDL86016.1 restriction system protein [Sediminibacillus halophilus]